MTVDVDETVAPLPVTRSLISSDGGGVSFGATIVGAAPAAPSTTGKLIPLVDPLDDVTGAFPVDDPPLVVQAVRAIALVRTIPAKRSCEGDFFFIIMVGG